MLVTIPPLTQTHRIESLARTGRIQRTNEQRLPINQHLRCRLQLLLMDNNESKPFWLHSSFRTTNAFLASISKQTNSCLSEHMIHLPFKRLSENILTLSCPTGGYRAMSHPLRHLDRIPVSFRSSKAVLEHSLIQVSLLLHQRKSNCRG